MTMLVSQRYMMLSCLALAVFMAVSSNAICVATAVSWRLTPFYVPKTAGGAAAATFVRGGNVSSNAEDTLRQYLQEAGQAGKFYVQGWRWHTLSVKREAERLQRLAEQMESEGVDLPRLRKAADYVVDFNLKALHRVEAMFFPKMRDWMKDSKEVKPEVISAFKEVLSSLEADNKKLAALGKSIVSAAKFAIESAKCCCIRLKDIFSLLTYRITLWQVPLLESLAQLHLRPVKSST